MPGGMNMKRFAVTAVVALGALLTTAPGLGGQHKLYYDLFDIPDGHR
jgi:hypothetical protein